MTNKPHDALFKAAFEHPEHAAALFRAILPPAIADTIDWTTTAHVPGSFVGSDLADYHSDLLFSAETHLDRVRRYMLLEHRSTDESGMPVRMVIYVGQIWSRHRKQNTGPVPPVFPLLVSHAPGGWTGPRVLHDALALHPSTSLEFTPLVPNFTMLVDDLMQLTNEALEARALPAFPKLALWLLRDARHGRQLLDNLPFWAGHFREARRAPHGDESVRALLNYITLVNEHISWEEFHAIIHQQAPEAEDVTMTIAEELIAKGRAEGLTKGRAEALTIAEELIAKGRAEGLTKGRADQLSKQLRLKFGPLSLDDQARLAAASTDELDLWAERVLSAPSIEEVFARA